MNETNDVTQANQILLNLLSGFYWLDEGLQSYIRARGWPTVTRPQSMVMANVVMGVRYPSEIARRLGISRQAIHATLKSMNEMDMVRLVDDPNNMRVKLVELTETGEAMRRDAQRAMTLMTEELIRRIGKQAFDQTAATLAQDWGAPLSFSPEDVARD
ncbi:MAG: winged helix-turn-helix transcriptional regulator [Alphaproteobacteria bacterium]|nr:winged helix-turn-helix transcriptional regulator [Alphaproteobacteria bacterium]|tara:strand:- start:8708 stop:9181 length:474 start_codon:yes stop_codon:yes gene_type:complete